MFVLRILSAALAALLIVVIARDVANQRGQPGRLLDIEKGVYLGAPDTGISDETRALLRARGSRALEG